MLNKLIIKFKFKLYKMFSKIFSVKKVCTDSGNFLLTTSTENEVHRAFTFHEKEPETIAWINSFSSIVENGDDIIFFDVGANVGIYSLYAGTCYRQAQVVSFEPDSQSFGSLCRNININKLNILPYPFAISDELGVGIVKLSSMNAGAGACSLGDKYQFINAADDEIFKQGIFFCSLDELVLHFNFPIPTFIKIDVDGIEATILRGAKAVLGSDKCRGLLVEFQYETEADLNSIIDYLASLGFSISGKSDWIASFNLLKSRNFVFTKQ